MSDDSVAVSIQYTNRANNIAVAWHCAVKITCMNDNFAFLQRL